MRWIATPEKDNSTVTLEKRPCRVDEPAAYHAEGVLYLSPEARFDYLLTSDE